MIQLKSRAAIFSKAPLIASEISKIQTLFYDEEALELFKAEDQEQTYLDLFDNLEAEHVEAAAFTKIIGPKHKHKDLSTLTSNLADKLRKLFVHTRTTQLVLITHLNMNFFGNRENAYPPIVEAYRKLEEIAQSNTYIGAIQLGIDDLDTILEIIFWMTRCDPSSPEVQLLFDAEQRFAMNVCKHGNIHMTEYSEELITEALLKQIGWKLIDQC